MAPAAVAKRLVMQISMFHHQQYAVGHNLHLSRLTKRISTQLCTEL